MIVLSPVATAEDGPTQSAWSRNASNNANNKKNNNSNSNSKSISNNDNDNQNNDDNNKYAGRQGQERRPGHGGLRPGGDLYAAC